MELITTIVFKSIPDMFKKEHSGIKNNTIRFVDRNEDKEILAIIDNIKYIRIINIDDIACTLFFTRTIKDITRYIHNYNIIYIFTWEI